LLSSQNEKELGKRAANTIRLLAADAVQKANSGHPGMPMGMADCAYVLWTKYLRFNPRDPLWPNRDRFILSAGHGSALLYAMLHLSGYDVTMDDLQSFRQWQSRTPGHPETGCLPGVETTTGPLGQGFANGVGMAIAAKMMAARFNTDEFHLFGQHHVFAFVSDGDLMEGVAGEAASLAGHLRLGNLIYIYDDNQITIEGETRLTFSESVGDRFLAYGWRVMTVDGHDQEQISVALFEATHQKEKPTLIIAKTHIGFGSPNKQDKAEVHGSPLGEEELRLTKKQLGFNEQEHFVVPQEVRDLFQKRVEQLEKLYQGWQQKYNEWKNRYPQLHQERERLFPEAVDPNLEKHLVAALPEKTDATRSLSGKVMQKIAAIFPGFIGGSADLEPSTKTYLKESTSISADDFSGRNFHYGIREHAMGAINNGLALYGGFIPFGATFLVFADYMRPAIRLAALMELQSIFVFTHDSIFVGEDGPTHQPIEQLAALRAIPNLQVLRPADGLETAVCWAMALRKKDGSSALLLTRQKVAALSRDPSFKLKDIQRGAYVISKERNPAAEIVILASGSEVECALEAQKLLQEKGSSTRVVSVPCKELFEEQSEKYQRTIIPSSARYLVVVEAGVSFGWKTFFNLPMLFIGMDRFGASAPYQVLQEKFGFTGPAIARRIEKFIGKSKHTQ
jgi:transketolase